jgi:hypothetical protein
LPEEPEPQSLPQLRIAVARAEREARRSGGAASAADARRDLAEAKLADYITRVVADAPPLRESQRDRLVLLLRGDS